MPNPVRRPRLQGLKNPPKRQPGPPKTAKSAQPEKPKCPNCNAENLELVGDALVCQNCFTEADRTLIVAEVQFNEDAGGRATVQGGMVAENARHAKTMGGAPVMRKIGGGERNTAADIQNQGRRILSGLCPKLGIEEFIQIQAEQIWGLAAGINFSAGRKTDEVAGACLYAACRRQKDNRILLMDIAELLKINVFRIGEVYREMCKELYLTGDNVGHQHLQELEPLIKKYCDKLQFADKTKIVAEDALKIIRRMNRDWIVAGRNPAGLCGACIILAARMNNFQRSVREVVYVSKVADVTIAKRVEEFRRTRSAGLSVDMFRQYANKIKHQHDPPSLYLSNQREEIMEKRRQRRADHMRAQEQLHESQERQSQPPVINIPDDASAASSRLSSLEPVIGATDPRGIQRQTQADPTLSDTTGPVPTPPTTQPSSQLGPTEQFSEQASSQSTGKRKAESLGPSDDDAVQDDPSHKRQRTEEVSSSNDNVPSEPATQESTKRKRQNEDDARGSLDASPAPIQEIINGSSQKRPWTVDPSPTASQHNGRLGPRFDEDGFAIPALPPRVDSPEIEAPVPRKRGRPPKEDRPPEIDISQEELDVEDYLELEIEKALQDGEVEENRGEVENEKKEAEEKALEEALERAQALSREQQELEAGRLKEKREAAGMDYWNTDTDDLALEFENDPEIEHCLLKPHEVAIKEKIWVAHNEDWLRKQAEKEMLAEVAKATNPNGRGRKSKKGEKGGKRKKRGKMGDGSVLTESSTPIESPADATLAMLEKHRPQKSAHVDFSALQRIYGRQTPSRAGSTTPDGSGSSSVGVTPAPGREQSATPAPSEAAQAEVESTASPGATADDQDDDVEEDVGADEDPWSGLDQNPEADEDGDAEVDFRKAMLTDQVAEDEYGMVGGGDFGSYESEDGGYDEY
ncbi:Transcription factor IIIB 60 kDa subunit [Lecanosticta acicola]|uniref:Transcription factor IIIB 60 kDa subunit n=1 Tax=Lecanosticta acicola TaxID=111012 RepID=A0AAI9EBX9_9PEZI|nr:Transcription factor IIIB 60 kDa subunit [Lecanosticta acicola]